MKALAVLFGGLEEVLKGHVGAPQIENVAGPLYLPNKR